MSKLLTEYHVSLGADTAKFVKGMGVARHEVTSVVKTLRESEPAANKLAREIANLDKVFAKGGMASRQYALALEHLKKKYGEVQQAGFGSKFVDQLGSSFRIFTPEVLAASAAIGGLYGAFKLMKDSIGLAAELESASIQFEVMTGSIEQSKTLLKEMRQLADTTPLSFRGISQAAQTMIAFGVDTAKVMPLMRQLGDVARGDDERLKSLTLAFSQMSSAGRLMGQDLLQMVNAGFNPLQIISERTGVSMLELKKQMEDGRISTKLVELAFADATAEGGRFNGMLERAKDTFAGQTAQLAADIDVMKTKLGEEFLPLVKQVTKELNRMFEVSEGKSGDSFAGNLAKSLEFGFAGVMDTFDFFVKEEFAFDSPKLLRMQKLMREKLDKVIKDNMPAKPEDDADFIKPERAPNQELIDEIDKLKKDIAAEKDRLKKESTGEAQRMRIAEQELEQARKRLEVEKFGKAIAEKNEALRKGMTEADAERVRLMVEETEQLIHQQKIFEQMKREGEANKRKLEEMQKKAEEIGSTNKTNPDMIKAGSVEAYKFVMDKQGDQLKKMEEQKRIAQRQVEILRDISANTAQIRPMVVLG